MTAVKLNQRPGNEGPAGTTARHRREIDGGERGGNEEGEKMRLGFNGNIRFDHVNHICMYV